MACTTSPSSLRIESEDAFVGVVSAILLLRPLNQGDEDKPHDEAADMSPPRDAARGRRHQEVGDALKNLDQNQNPIKSMAGSSKNNGRNKIGTSTMTRANGNNPM